MDRTVRTERMIVDDLETDFRAPPAAELFAWLAARRPSDDDLRRMIEIGAGDDWAPRAHP